MSADRINIFPSRMYVCYWLWVKCGSAGTNTGEMAGKIAGLLWV